MNGGGASDSSPAVAETTRMEATKELPQMPPALRTKRAYEYSKGEMDVTMEKLYKCNYWEDPAYAAKLQRKGLELARSAALDNLIDSMIREFQAYMAGGELKDDEEDSW